MFHVGHETPEGHVPVVRQDDPTPRYLADASATVRRIAHCPPNTVDLNTGLRQCRDSMQLPEYA